MVAKNRDVVGDGCIKDEDGKVVVDPDGLRTCGEGTLRSF